MFVLALRSAGYWLTAQSAIYMSGTIIHSLGVPKPDTTRFNRDL
ncbi:MULTISPECIES: hypothetical protein [Brucella/Ochrobactrum group]|nr:hypothetical protein [Brucella sp. NBRC 12950]